MPTGDEGATASPASASAENETSLVPNQLAVLVPTFDPSKDDLQQYVSKVELLVDVWPKNRIHELSTRLILGCQGSAFKKLALHRTELQVNNVEAIKKLIQLLGGHWGQTALEKRYESAEKALFRCLQRTDESNDSYLARADIHWSELLAKKTTLEEIQAYVVLRGSQLSAEDKKRVLLECDVSDKGVLNMDRVTSAVRMLGAGFFQDMVGQKKIKGKTYDSTILVTETADSEDPAEENAMMAFGDQQTEDDFVDSLAMDGDEDALLVQDYEGAAADTVQDDTELAMAYNTYVDARRRLSERFRNRGFWPVSSKGKGRKGKGKSPGKGPRKSLQQRMLESNCRLCGKRGHWRAECPERNRGGSTGSQGSNPTAITTVSVANSADGLPMEFLILPEVNEGSIDETCQVELVMHSFCWPKTKGIETNKTNVRNRPSLRNHLRSEVPNLNRSEPTSLECHDPRSGSNPASLKSEGMSVEDESILFATHGSFGILDSGATKSVIGTSALRDLLKQLKPEVRDQLRRCPCQVTFRFGNQGTLDSHQALVVPIGDLLLKIAIVPGGTPFLLSNTLIRTLKATIDSCQHRLISPLLARDIPLHLNSKGLFLVDLNDLIESKKDGHQADVRLTTTAETFAVHAAKGGLPEKIPQTLKAVNETKDQPKRNSQSETSSVKKLISLFEQSGQPNSMSAEPRLVKNPDRSNCQTVPHHAEAKCFPACRSIREDDESDPSCSSQGRVSSAEHSGNDGTEDRLRQDACGSHICRDVDRGEQMGQLVPEDILIVNQGRTCEVSDLRGKHAGSPRTATREFKTTSCRRTTARDCFTDSAAKHPAQGQSSNTVNDDIRRRLRSGLHLRGMASSPRRGGENRVDGDAESDGAPRECPSGSHSTSESFDPASEFEQLDTGAGIADDSNDVLFTSPCQMQKKLNEWIETMSKELDLVIRTHGESNPSTVDLLEVFCSAQSELTHQVRQLGRKADRFGFSQGDLSTSEGRTKLFELLIQKSPRHLWYSPTCGPWSSWNQLNAQKSLQQFDAVNQEQTQHLYQLALGIVLLRFQVLRGCHMHWEQPGKSLMFRSPLLQEVFCQTVGANFDLCNVGELRDPQNHLPMKKNLTVRTTSRKLHENLNGLWCRRNHEHQQISGSCKVQGQWMSRTQFSENYPRKFARKVAKVLTSFQRPRELPIRDELCTPCFVSEQPEPKRRRVTVPVATLPPVPLEDPERCLQPSFQKRRRLDMKQTVPAESAINQVVQKIVQDVFQLLPRVGRTEITSSQLRNEIQSLFPEKQIVKILAGKGTDRTTPPPKDLNKIEAPFRRSIIQVRQTKEVKVEREWEKWDNLAQRQIVRKGHPAHVSITVFARNPEERSSSSAAGVEREPESVPSQSIQTTAAIPPAPEELDTKTEIQEEKSPMLSNTEVDLKHGKHGEHFRALGKTDQASLLRMHANLGHPSAVQLSVSLRQQGYPKSWIDAVKDMSCSVCQMKQAPRNPRPSTLKSDLDFNDKIAIDGVTWTNSKGKTFHFYHVLDLGTNYQVAMSAPNRSTPNVISFMLQNWLNWAGPPNELCSDAAGEFMSEEFEQFLHKYNIKSHNIAPGAHWQQGRAERHGAVLQNMLTKYDCDVPIETYDDLGQGLVQCTHAKNANSLRHGYAPDVLVFGKGLRTPGSITSDDSLPSHVLADEDNCHGIRFREFLAKREAARRAFVTADNDSAIRRAALRRSRPDRGTYTAGDWVMVWRETKNEKRWLGPMKVVSQDGSHTIWCSHVGKIIRAAPEHVRHVSTVEAQIQLPNEPTTEQNPAQTVPAPAVLIPSEGQPNVSLENGSQEEMPETRHRLASAGTEGQPDMEPEVESIHSQRQDEGRGSVDASQIPVPESEDEELIVCDALICQDVDDNRYLESTSPLGWRAEFNVQPEDLETWLETVTTETAYIATSAKKQHTEVKLTELLPHEVEEFEQAKGKEIQNWLSTGTVQKILRNKLAPEQVLRCRWILTWKALDEQEQKETKRTHKAKARLVVLGYLDPELESIPRDSPTLSRQSRMLALQMIASKQWTVRSFDVKSAFLQGKTQDDRQLGIEPVEELRRALKLKPQEICQLTKSAYGLIDAPFLWYRELDRSLIELGFIRSPFDPCLYTLHEPNQKHPSGIIGIHVDDGLCGGNEYFMSKLQELEARFAFGSKRSQTFCFTGIDIFQHPDKTITLSQEKYVSKIEPIHLEPGRRTCLDQGITPKEKQDLRGLIGSLQYAAVNTRPDLSSRLSYLQGKINSATVQTLIDANRVLHEAKRFKDTVIYIQPIAVDDLRFLTFSDASFASAKEPNSHAGMIVMTTHKDINQNYTCPVNAITWGCKKIQRVVTSTLAAETTALNTALDQVSWLKMYWGWLIDPTMEWQRPKQALQKLPIAIATAASEVQSIAATDCKSLFDLITRTAPPNCSEWRTQLLAKSIKDLLSEGTALRWVHSGAQLADALTKIMETSFLRRTLDLGRYKLHDELETLKNRANHRSRLQWLKEEP